MVPETPGGLEALGDVGSWASLRPAAAGRPGPLGACLHAGATCCGRGRFTRGLFPLAGESEAEFFAIRTSGDRGGVAHFPLEAGQWSYRMAASPVVRVLSDSRSLGLPRCGTGVPVLGVGGGVACSPQVWCCPC
ncbi:hypothetical protein NDU88_001680 [Pleurodeles waltl]|uniref:Uncharacterized protein n=1 Tax=Pleurodeles waltl TaxID=8319 RepID=A0AAV7MQK6_PLEWA|nr:hypothetical protein NDU88_001680 [Pleurodeles waltl]